MRMCVPAFLSEWKEEHSREVLATNLSNFLFCYESPEYQTRHSSVVCWPFGFWIVLFFFWQDASWRLWRQTLFCAGQKSLNCSWSVSELSLICKVLWRWIYSSQGKKRKREKKEKLFPEVSKSWKSSEDIPYNGGSLLFRWDDKTSLVVAQQAKGPDQEDFFAHVCGCFHGYMGLFQLGGAITYW